MQKSDFDHKKALINSFVEQSIVHYMAFYERKQPYSEYVRNKERILNEMMKLVKVNNYGDE